MASILKRNDESLTAHHIVEFYANAYELVHGTKPTCEYTSGNWFVVNGVKRDRRWLMLEIELLHQKFITNTLDAPQATTRTGLLNIIRNFRRLSG